MQTYNPDEMVRLELLCYENPDGLHPVEENWRNLARKLYADVQELEKLVEKHDHYSDPDRKCFKCGVTGKIARNWPSKFQPKV